MTPQGRPAARPLSPYEQYLRERATRQGPVRQGPLRQGPYPGPRPHSRPQTAPSSYHSKPAPKRKLTPEQRKKYLKWGLWTLAILILYFAFQWIVSLILQLLQLNPVVWAVYKSAEEAIVSRSLLGLYYAAASCATFLSALPVEAFFLYYLGLSYPPLVVVLVTLGGVLSGALFNYVVGWIIGPRVIKWFIKEKYDSFHRKVERAGGLIVVIGNIIPFFPCDLFAVFLGTVRYGFLRLLIYTAIGRLLQFGLLWLGYKYFLQYISPYLGTLSWPWLVHLVKSGFS